MERSYGVPQRRKFDIITRQCVAMVALVVVIVLIIVTVVVVIVVAIVVVMVGAFLASFFIARQIPLYRGGKRK